MGLDFGAQSPLWQPQESFGRVSWVRRTAEWDSPAAGTWHGAHGCRIGLSSLSPPLQKHLSLMKCFPLCGHLAHTATRQLLSDKEGVGGQASRQVGLASRLDSPVSEDCSSTHSASLGLSLFLCRGCARQELGELGRIPGGGARGCPSGWVSLPCPLPPADLFLPTANSGSRACASPHAGPSACSVVSVAQACVPKDNRES